MLEKAHEEFVYVDEDAMDEDLIYALHIHVVVDIMTALEADMIERNDQRAFGLCYSRSCSHIILMLVITIGFMQSICLKVNRRIILIYNNSNIRNSKQMRCLLKLIAIK